MSINGVRDRREVVARLVVVLAAVATGLVLAGFWLGRQPSPTRVLTGVPQVGNHVTTIDVDGVFYGFRDSLPWYDVSGALHDGGWPSCLGSGTGAPRRVTFGVTRVDYPDGSANDQIVYVDCGR